MTVEQSANYAAVQYTRKCLVMRLSVPLCDNLAVFGKAAYVQTLFIRRSAAKTNAVRRIFFLKR